MSEMDTTTPTHYGAALEMVAALREEVRHLRERRHTPDEIWRMVGLSAPSTTRTG